MLAVAEDIVTRLRCTTARCWCAAKSQGEPVGKPFFRCESCDDHMRAADEIERLRAAGDALVAAIRNHDLREEHIKTWKEARRG